MWPEVEQALLNHRYELILSGDKINKRLEEENELDRSIWTLERINFLEISQCPLLYDLPEDIGKLKNLSTLTLTSNNLKKLPDQIKYLENLRHLNLSNNQLTKLDDQFFFKLNHLETINLTNNLLEEFPSLSYENNKKLAIIYLSHNKLEKLQDFPQQLENLSYMDLSSNQFKHFPNTILQLNSLKTLFIDSNQLTDIPPQLSQLHKLKEIRFKSNPLKDNRLKKLMEQDKIKAVLEYLSKQWQDQQKLISSTTTKTKTHIIKQQQEQQGEIKSNENIQDKIEILHFDQPGDLKGKQITILPRVVNVRPYILCCIVRNIDLATPGNLKKFLNIQCLNNGASIFQHSEAANISDIFLTVDSNRLNARY
ncbi:unnamed protein product [Rotaria sp. Silwood1]|nr:unnamed protein product [Rotaria sp. Silwood1]